MAKADFGDKALKSRPPLGRGARAAEIIVDDGNPRARPAKVAGMVDKPVLHLRRFTMVLQLLEGRLPDVDDGLPVKVAGEDLARQRSSILGLGVCLIGRPSLGILGRHHKRQPP